MDNKAFTNDDGRHRAVTADISDEAPASSTNGSRTESRASPLAPHLGRESSKSSAPESGPGEKVRLKRVVGPVSAIGVILGTMIGAGIFVSSQSVLARTGSVALALCVWLGCGLLSTLGGLCYIELGTVVPKSGGEFMFFLDSFGPLHHYLGSLPSFLYAWMTCLVTRPANTAIQSLVFAEYCIRPFFTDGCAPPSLSIDLIAVSATCFATFVNCYSVRLTTDLQNLFTMSKLTMIVVILGAGLYALFSGEGTTRHLTTGFHGSTSSISDIATAFYSGLWAYDGWNNLNFLTEELVSPDKNLPLAIAVGLPLVTLLYLLVNVAYLTVLTPVQLMASPAVAVTFAEHALGLLAALVPIGVAVSVCGAINGGVLTTSRICFTAARQGHFSDVLGLIQRHRLTPAPAVLFNMVLAVAMISAGDINALIDFSSFTVWLFYGLSMVALLILRRTRPLAPRPFRVPLWMPWLVLLMAIYLVVSPVVSAPRLLYLYVLVFLLVGVAIHDRVVYRQQKIPGMKWATVVVQKLIEVVPCDK